MPTRNPIHELQNFLRLYFTPAVRWLLVANVALFLADWLARGLLPNTVGWIFSYLYCCPYLVRHGMVWQLVTYAFFHADPFHLFFNMLMLGFLGNMVERRIGTGSFLRLYFLAAVAGGLAHVALFVWRAPMTMMLGASGAVMAVSVVAAIYYFDVMVLLMGVFPMKLGYLVWGLVALDVLYMLGPTSGATANYAHVAGAAVGFLFVKLNWRLDWGWTDIWRWRMRAFLARLGLTKKQSRPNTKSRIQKIWDDDYFKK